MIPVLVVFLQNKKVTDRQEIISSTLTQVKISQDEAFETVLH